MTAADLSNPILCSPYDPPDRHFELGPSGPTEVKTGRRPSESFIPVPPAKKKGAGQQQQLEVLDATGDRRAPNELINEIRWEIEKWRINRWNGVTPYTRKLLDYWTNRDEPVLFCQREAAETAIFLAEVAGRHGTTDWRRRLEAENEVHNDGLPRIGLKMATGAGKTVVMAMLIAWQTVNKVYAPRDARFAKRFLIVTPGITIRDRLGVLHPERADSYFDERDLIPPDLRDALNQAQIEIVNYHAFLPRDAKEIQGVSATTRKLLRDPAKPQQLDAFRETPDMVAGRILRAFGAGATKGEVVVMNDEAHHCYQDKPLDLDDKIEKEDAERNRDARVWFRGLLELKRKAGVKAVYDLSATPYYLKGSGYNEGHLFPWVVSDFSLMDAIESGIVKVPRLPVDDDAKTTEVVYLNLWDHIDPPLPKRKSAKADHSGATGWTPPATLEGALRSLYRSYEAHHRRYETELAHLGEPPPVMIVVCPNTVVSKLVYDWISGREAALEGGDTQLKVGNLGLLSNVEDGKWVNRLRTILVDSEQLESGEPLGGDFRTDAAVEIEAFKRAWRDRNPGGDPDKLTDADLLREVMNTIGKRGQLGEHIRCVVSVAMLTEGWDANTVTHILGIRPFRSQLLCEQVVGRGLRRRSYAVNGGRRFEPEYAEVYGVPFAFIPGDKRIEPGPPARPALEVTATDDRAEFRIDFPKLDGYRAELPDAPLQADFSGATMMHLDLSTFTTWVEQRGVVGTAEEVDLDEVRNARPQRVAFELAKRLAESERFYAAADGAERPWLFPQLVDIAKRWLVECFAPAAGVPVGALLITEHQHYAAEKVFDAILRHPDAPEPLLLPVIRRFDPEGSTNDVRFLTRKVVMDPPPTRSHVNHVVLDGPRGNTWEEAVAYYLEHKDEVAAYVKNDRLGFEIPYVHKGRSHTYLPDFLVRLVPESCDVIRTLIVEVSGSHKSPGPTAAKADTARNQWCAAVNNWGLHGVWGYVEVGSIAKLQTMLDEAIANLYAEAPITGLPA